MSFSRSGPHHHQWNIPYVLCCFKFTETWLHSVWAIYLGSELQHAATSSVSQHSGSHHPECKLHRLCLHPLIPLDVASAFFMFQARRGCFLDMLSAPIIPALLDSGLVFVLRWALDDNTENSLTAAVNALRALLVCDQDEVELLAPYCKPHIGSSQTYNYI